MACEKGGIEAAKQKHDVIMTPNTYLYFDYYQAKDIENEPFGIGGYLPMERVYSYEPMPASLTRKNRNTSRSASQPLDIIHRYLPACTVHGIASLGCFV